MALILDESFVTGIPASFATLRQQAGTLTASYDATAQAVDLSNATAGQNIYDITSVPLAVAGEMEIDLELVADLSGASNYRHAGAWAVAGQAAVSNGIRSGHLATNYFMDSWMAAASWAGNTPTVTVPQWAEAPFNIAGDRRIFNLRWDMSAGAGLARFPAELRIDGVLVLAGGSVFPSLRPGVHLYQSTVRLHSIKVWNAPQAALTSIAARELDANGARLGLLGMAPPEALDALGIRNKVVAPIVGKRDIYFGGRGRVAGTVKVTPATPVSRRVVLIDEASRLIIRETWSDAVSGAYSFDGVDTSREYTVLSYDHTGAYRAVVADGQIPELIP